MGDSVARQSRGDGTARVVQAETQAHHPLHRADEQQLTRSTAREACRRVCGTAADSERTPRPERRGECHSLRCTTAPTTYSTSRSRSLRSRPFGSPVNPATVSQSSGSGTMQNTTAGSSPPLPMHDPSPGGSASPSSSNRAIASTAGTTVTATAWPASGHETILSGEEGDRRVGRVVDERHARRQLEIEIRAEVERFRSGVRVRDGGVGRRPGESSVGVTAGEPGRDEGGATGQQSAAGGHTEATGAPDECVPATEGRPTEPDL